MVRVLSFGWLTGLLVAAAQPAVTLPVQASGAGLAQAAGSQSEQVTGTVTYRARIALPPNATLVVRLQEVSRLDAPAVTLAEQIIPTEGQQVPFAFALGYDPSQIDPRYTYVVRAQILVEGQLRWTSTRIYQVITRGNPSQVEIEVEPVASSASTPPSQPSGQPSQTTPVVQSRYSCTARSRAFPRAENISLEEAQRLRLQRDGNRFVYQCEPTPEPDVRYDCRSQNSAYPSRTVGLTEAERLLRQTANNAFVYDCSPV
jgi:putative lipoprotein